LQSFSYDGNHPLLSNETTHWENQKKWLLSQGYQNLSNIQRIEKFWVDDYYYHWNVSQIYNKDIIWKIHDMQLLKDTRTMYIGGSASYETVEDSFQYNLKLVNEFIDSASNFPMPISEPMIEQLVYTIPCSEINRFINISSLTWDPFFVHTPGFVSKKVLVKPNASLLSGHCDVRVYVEWNARDIYENIDPTVTSNVTKHFNALWGSVLTPSPRPPNNHMLDIISSVSLPTERKDGDDDDDDDDDHLLSLEINRLDFFCKDIKKFLSCDNSTWTSFLVKQPGFIEKKQLSPPTLSANGNCSIYTHVQWSDHSLWKNISIQSLINEQKKFVKCFGYTPPLTSLPVENHGSGQIILKDHIIQPKHPTILALGGMDVVSYHFLKKGEHDVSVVTCYSFH
jgi:hypothetical protein